MYTKYCNFSTLKIKASQKSSLFPGLHPRGKKPILDAQFQKGGQGHFLTPWGHRTTLRQCPQTPRSGRAQGLGEGQTLDKLAEGALPLTFPA